MSQPTGAAVQCCCCSCCDLMQRRVCNRESPLTYAQVVRVERGVLANSEDAEGHSAQALASGYCSFVQLANVHCNEALGVLAYAEVV